MKPMIVMVEHNKQINTHYFDIPIAETPTEPPPSALQKIAHVFNRVGATLKKLFMEAAALFTKGRYLTPGKYQSFANNRFINAQLRRLLSCSYYLTGSAATVLFIAPAAVGVTCELLGASLDMPQFQFAIRKSRSTRSAKAKPLVLLTRNTALLPSVVTNYSHLRPSSERISEIIDSIVKSSKARQVDVLCLQEVFGLENAKKLVNGLDKKFKHFIYHIAPGKVGLDSGLFFASNHDIVHARYIRPPLPHILKANNFMKVTTSIESLTNKGILYVLVKNGDTYDIIINAHIKSNIGIDHIETNAIKEIRAEGLRVLAQGLFDYIDEVEEKFAVDVSNVYIGADLNVSDVQENYEVTYERTGKKNGIRILTGLHDLSFIFENMFPSPTVETWLMDHSREPNEHSTGFGQEHYNNPQIPHPEVCFDHAGVFTYRTHQAKKYFSFEVSRFDDQGFSKGKGSPSSDHAGILLTPKL